MLQLILVSFLATVLSAKPGTIKESAACPSNLSLQPDFKITKYLGLWYEQAKDQAASVFERGECQQARYRATLRIVGGPRVPGNIYKVINSEYLRDEDRLSTIEGTVKC